MKLAISTRLTIWYSLLLMLAMLVFGVLSFMLIANELYNEQYNILNENAEEISEFIRFRDGVLDVDHLIHETDELNLKQNGIFFQVWSDSLGHIFRSRNFPPFLKTSFSMPPEGSQRHVVDEMGTAFHIYTYIPGPVQPRENIVFKVRVGQSVLYVQKLIEHIRALLLMLAPLVLLLAGVGGWMLARRSLRPVAEITETAREMSLYHLDKRLPEPEQNDEIRQLVRTFNAMMERIQTGVAKIQQFTADASHELRTPLTILQGEIEVTLRKPRENSEYMATLQSNLKEIYWMEKIVNDLLLLSRADAGEVTLRKKPIDLAELAKEGIQSHQRHAGEKNIAIHFQMPPASFEGAVDANRMRQVINNVLDNAIKYTPAGGAINVDLKREHDRIALTVADNGVGIPQKDIPFVFDRFYRVDKSRSREQHSSGLGLAICKWIVEAHGGGIEIESKEGKGTIVKIVLPRK